MKKITFLLLHLGFGGIETSTINTANALVPYYDIEIISFYKLPKDQFNNLNRKVRVKYLYNGEPNKKELMHAIKHFRIFSIIKETCKSIKILYLKKHLIVKEIKACSSDYIISTRNEYTILLSKYGKKGIKIAQEHMHHNDIKKYVDNIKYRFTNIDYLFALTDSLKNDYEKFLANNHHTKVVLVPNMIDLPDKKVDFNNNNLITIARLHPVKKIDELIEIFSKIDNKNNKLYIVGDGSEIEYLKSVAIEKGVEKRVVFTGYMTKFEMEKYILDSSIFLMTSASEGLPMVLLEAMSYGIPCIAYSTRSGVKDIIDDGINGYVVENRDQNTYINIVNELLSDDGKLKYLSENALSKAQKYSRENIVEIWKSLLK